MLQTTAHVLYESTTWMAAFNLALSLLSFVVSFADNAFKLPPPPPAATGVTATSLHAARTILSSCVHTICTTCTASQWEVHTVSDRWLGELALPRFDVEKGMCSFHVPLHRALSKILERLSLCGFPGLLTFLSAAVSGEATPHAYLVCVEPVLRTVVMAAQVGLRGRWLCPCLPLTSW